MKPLHMDSPGLWGKMNRGICKPNHMKPLSVILLLLLSHKISGQVFIILEPQFFRPGVMVHVPTQQRVGVYGKAWYGDMYKHSPWGTFYAQNIKVSAGISYELRKKKLEDPTFRVVAGIYKSYYFDVSDNGVVPVSKLHRVRGEIGWIITDRRVSITAITDPWTWETCFGVSYRFRSPR